MDTSADHDLFGAGQKGAKRYFGNKPAPPGGEASPDPGLPVGRRAKSGASPLGEGVERFKLTINQGLLLGLRPSLDLLLTGDGFGLGRMRLGIDQCDGATNLRVDCALAGVVGLKSTGEVFRMAYIIGAV